MIGDVCSFTAACLIFFCLRRSYYRDKTSLRNMLTGSVKEQKQYEEQLDITL